MHKKFAPPIVAMQFSVVVCAMLSGCTQGEFGASAEVEENLKVTLVVSTFSGHYAEGPRRISIEYDNNRIEMDLFEDTGWWRGSNLYSAKSGYYVLNEGQAGCVTFKISPLAFLEDRYISCGKHLLDGEVHDGGSIYYYYKDVKYLGIFMRPPDGENPSPAVFLGPDSFPEKQLREML